jgi:N-acetylglucosamine kinase-like BadF-type ATPase
MKYLLGIDAGATKTHLSLADDGGAILARVQTGPSNLHDIAATQISKMFAEAFTKVSKQATGKSRVALDALAIGWAGLDSPHDQQVAKTVIKHAFHHALPAPKHARIVNDTIIGLWSGSTSSNGICVIGGTGSNGYGRNKKGKEAWAGGLGHLMADEGSGYEVGLKILHAAAKSSDGRGPKTLLEKLLLKKFGVKKVRDLVPIVYAPGFGKHQVGQIAYLLEQATNEGDAVARDIAMQSAHELVLIASSVATQLGFTKRTSFDLVTIGGLLKHDPVISKTFKARIAAAFPFVQVVVPSEDPVIGAVRLAQSLL